MFFSIFPVTELGGQFDWGQGALGDIWDKHTSQIYGDIKEIKEILLVLKSILTRLKHMVTYLYNVL